MMLTIWVRSKLAVACLKINFSLTLILFFAFYYDYLTSIKCASRAMAHGTHFPGDVPRVNGQLAVSRAFGDKSLKSHLRSDPDIQNTIVDISCDVLILASDGLWKVMLFPVSIAFVVIVQE